MTATIISIEEAHYLVSAGLRLNGSPRGKAVSDPSVATTLLRDEGVVMIEVCPYCGGTECEDDGGIPARCLKVQGDDAAANRKRCGVRTERPRAAVMMRNVNRRVMQVWLDK